MTLQEIYQLPSIEESSDLNIICDFTLDGLITDWVSPEVNQKNDKIVIKIHNYRSYNHTLYWDRLATVWFEDKPVMVISNYGKDGGYHDQQITNADRFKEMCVYIKSIIPIDFEKYNYNIKSLTKKAEDLFDERLRKLIFETKE